MPRQPSPDIQFRNLNDTMKRLPRHLQIAWVVEFCGKWDSESLVMGRALEFLTYLKEKAEPETATAIQAPVVDTMPILEAVVEPVPDEAVPVPEEPAVEEWYEGPVSGLTGAPLTKEDLSGYLVNGSPMPQSHILDMACGYADEINSMAMAVTVLREQGFDIQEPCS